MKPMRIFNAMCATPWLIEPDALRNMIAIANREIHDIQALEAKRAKRLESTSLVGVRGDVAIIPVMGPIFRYANLFTEISGATSLEMLAIEFDKAIASSAVQRIILNIDSPGGQASGISEFADMVRASPKPVTAYVGDLCASAAYWIAAACDDIAIAKTASLGSIGVVLQLERKGDDNSMIEIVSTQSPNKRVDIETEGGLAQMQSYADELAAIFIDSVAVFRGTDSDTVATKFGKGGLLIGAKAMRAKMADRISSFEDEVARGKKVSNQTRVKAMAIDKEDKAVTLADIEVGHPEIIGQVRQEAYESGVAAGKTLERDRIREIEEKAALPGHDDLVRAAKFDGVTTAADLALKVVAREKATRESFGAQYVSESVKPVDFVEQPAPQAEAPVNQNASLEDRCKASWASDAELREEFGDIENYIAYSRASELGRVRVKSIN